MFEISEVDYIMAKMKFLAWLHGFTDGLSLRIAVVLNLLFNMIRFLTGTTRQNDVVLKMVAFDVKNSFRRSVPAVW